MSEVQWIKNGEVITINATVTNNGSGVTNIFYNGSLSQLSITSASAQDSGKYTCNVTNKVNGTIDSTSIVIQGMYTMFITCCTTFLRHYFSHCSGLNFSFEIFSCGKKPTQQLCVNIIKRIYSKIKIKKVGFELLVCKVSIFL